MAEKYIAGPLLSKKGKQAEHPTVTVPTVTVVSTYWLINCLYAGTVSVGEKKLMGCELTKSEREEDVVNSINAVDFTNGDRHPSFERNHLQPFLERRSCSPCSYTPTSHSEMPALVSPSSTSGFAESEGSPSRFHAYSPPSSPGTPDPTNTDTPPVYRSLLSEAIGGMEDRNAGKEDAITQFMRQRGKQEPDDTGSPPPESIAERQRRRREALARRRRKADSPDSTDRRRSNSEISLTQLERVVSEVSNKPDKQRQAQGQTSGKNARVTKRFAPPRLRSDRQLLDGADRQLLEAWLVQEPSDYIAKTEEEVLSTSCPENTLLPELHKRVKDGSEEKVLQRSQDGMEIAEKQNERAQREWEEERMAWKQARNRRRNRIHDAIDRSREITLDQKVVSHMYSPSPKITSREHTPTWELTRFSTDSSDELLSPYHGRLSDVIQVE
eukprot:g16081.t1